MAISDFFSTELPAKLQSNPGLAGEINAVYQFDIDGAGSWNVDLTSGSGAVAEGNHSNPGCTVTAKAADFETLLSNPGQATMLFMMGKLKVTNVGLAIALQKLLS